MSKPIGKRNYEAIANVLAKHNRIPGPFGGFMLDTIVKDLANYFEKTDRKFNRNLFELSVWEGQGSD